MKRESSAFSNPSLYSSNRASRGRIKIFAAMAAPVSPEAPAIQYRFFILLFIENNARTFHMKSAGVAVLILLTFFVIRLAARPPLAREQRADVCQKLIGADRAIAVLFHQTVNHIVDTPRLVWIGRLR